MKRIIYIASFSFLGVLLSIIVHGLVEMWYLGFLNADFSTFGFGWTWETWVLIHHVASLVLFAAGIIFGYRQGVYWWQVLYVERRHRRSYVPWGRRTVSRST